MSNTEEEGRSKRNPSPPLNCPCCNSPGFVFGKDHRFRSECTGCGLATEWCETKEAALRSWNKRFDGQYRITARELEAIVVTSLRVWFDYRRLEYPQCLQNPERYPLSQVVTGCCSSLYWLTEERK